MYAPPFAVTPLVVAQVADILRKVGQYEGLLSPAPQPHLRRRNSIRTIQGSLAIEGNTLSDAQITAVLEGRRVVGPSNEIREVKNALRAYEKVSSSRPSSEADFLRAHKLLMNGLVDDPGRYRKRGVGIVAGNKVAHVAPPPARIPKLMTELFSFAKSSPHHPLITGSVFHYEVEFIHPFDDGNGRMGRLWQHIFLARFHPVFEYIPTESVIRDRQKDYYRVLGDCDRAGDSTAFVEFSLDAVLTALTEFLGDVKPAPVTANDRMRIAKAHFRRRSFSRKEYVALIKTLSTATASRDLKAAVDGGRLLRDGERALTRYRFK